MFSWLHVPMSIQMSCRADLKLSRGQRLIPLLFIWASISAATVRSRSEFQTDGHDVPEHGSERSDWNQARVSDASVALRESMWEFQVLATALLITFAPKPFTFKRWDAALCTPPFTARSPSTSLFATGEICTVILSRSCFLSLHSYYLLRCHGTNT
jgi:hypothetical protein